MKRSLAPEMLRRNMIGLTAFRECAPEGGARRTCTVQLTGLPERTIKGRTFKNAKWGEFKLHDTFFGAATNMWILKPSQGYEGRGIEIFRSLEELEKFLQIYLKALFASCRLLSLSFVIVLQLGPQLLQPDPPLCPTISQKQHIASQA